MQMEKMQKLRNRRETWNSRRIICFVVSCCDICVFCLCMFCLGAPACQIGGKALRGARRPGNACEERIGRAKEQIAVSFFDVYALFLLFCFSFEASDADFHACWTTATMTTTAFTVGSTGWIPHGTLFRRILTAFFLLINFLFIIYCFFFLFLPADCVFILVFIQRSWVPRAEFRQESGFPRISADFSREKSRSPSKFWNFSKY